MPDVGGGLRIAITGIGVVSPFGIGRECFWHHVSRGCSGVRAISAFDASEFPCRVAAPVPSIDPAAVFGVDGAPALSEHADPRRYSRVSLIAVMAAREAWTD